MKRVATVVIPTLNEAERIGGLLAQLGRTDAGLVAEILVTDGGSDDATRALVLDAATRDARVRLIDNPARRQGPGINRAVAEATPAANTIVRIDAHALYPDDFVERILGAFARTDAQMIAVRLDTRGVTCCQRGIAAVSNSFAGTGGAAHRMGGRSGFVDHGHHAGIDRRLFEAAGGYDEAFDANEDAELDYRIRRLGGRIWLATEIEVIYFPRRTLAALFVQYRRYGEGRARTFLKHREKLRPRQLAAPAIVLGLIASVIGGLFFNWLITPAALYVVAVIGVAVALAWRTRSLCALFAAPSLVTMHLAWGLGFLRAMRFRINRTVARSGYRGG